MSVALGRGKVEEKEKKNLEREKEKAEGIRQKKKTWERGEKGLE